MPKSFVTPESELFLIFGVIAVVEITACHRKAIVQIVMLLSQFRRSHPRRIAYIDEMGRQMRIDCGEFEERVYNLLLCVLPVTEHQKGVAVHEAIMQSQIAPPHLAVKLIQHFGNLPIFWKMVKGKDSVGCVSDGSTCVCLDGFLLGDG